MRRLPLNLIVLGAVLRLLFLNQRSLWFDEAATLYISQSPLDQIVGLVARLEENPPLHYLLAHVWEPLFRDPLVAIRLFSALCGIASLPLFYALCRRLAPKNPELPLALAAVSSFWIHFSQDGRIYGLLLQLALADSLLLLRAVERWSRARAAAYALVSLAGLYTHNFFALLILSHAVWLGLERRLRAPWVLLFTAVGLVYLPWSRVVVSQIRLLSRASVLQEPLTLRNLCYVLGTMAFDTSFLSLAHAGLTTALGAGLIALLLAGFRLGKGELDGGARFCLVQLIVPLAALRAIELFSGHPATQARYLIFVSPFLYILIGWAADHAPPLERLKNPALAVFAAGAIGYIASGFYADPRLGDLAKAIRQTTDPHDVIVYLDPYWYLPMRHYYLPERTHKLAGPRADIANWEEMPGYPAYISRSELAALPRVVVIDPRHALLPNRVGLAAGAQVAAVAYP